MAFFINKKWAQGYKGILLLDVNEEMDLVEGKWKVFLE